jgi:hypothetical protein
MGDASFESSAQLGGELHGGRNDVMGAVDKRNLLVSRGEHIAERRRRRSFGLVGSPGRSGTVIRKNNGAFRWGVMILGKAASDVSRTA